MSERLFYEIFDSCHRVHLLLDVTVVFDGIFWSQSNVLTLTQHILSPLFGLLKAISTVLSEDQLPYSGPKVFELPSLWGQGAGEWKTSFLYLLAKTMENACWWCRFLEVVQFNLREYALWNKWLPPWFTFVEGCGECSPRQVAEFAYLLAARQLKPGKSCIPQLIQTSKGYWLMS